MKKNLKNLLTTIFIRTADSAQLLESIEVMHFVKIFSLSGI